MGAELVAIDGETYIGTADDITATAPRYSHTGIMISTTRHPSDMKFSWYQSVVPPGKHRKTDDRGESMMT